MDPIRRIMRLCEHYSEDYRRFLARFNYPYFSNLERLAKEHPLPRLSLAALDEYDFPELANLIAFFPPRAVYNHLGKSAMLWSWLRHTEGFSCFFPHVGDFNQAIEEKVGRKLDQLRKSRKAVEAKAETKDARTILALDDLISDVNSGFLQEIDLPHLLRQHIKTGVSLAKERVEKYALLPLNTTYDHHGYAQEWGDKKVDCQDTIKKFRVYVDAPIAIGLFYEGFPTALVGFSLTTPKTLLIYQLQGVRAEIYTYKLTKSDSWSLEPLDWKVLLVSCVEQLARKRKMKTLGIQSWKHNHWCKDNPHEFPLKRAMAIYDQTAERLGFKKKKNGNWYLSLRK